MHEPKSLGYYIKQTLTKDMNLSLPSPSYWKLRQDSLTFRYGNQSWRRKNEFKSFAFRFKKKRLSVRGVGSIQNSVHIADSFNKDEVTRNAVH